MARGVYTRIPGKRGPRRRWTPEQVKAIAARWVELRLIDPVEYPIKLLARAQEVLDESLRRKIATFTAARDVAREIGKQWKALADKAGTPAPDAPPIPVRIAEIEVKVKLTKAEMLELCSEVDLESLLIAKRLARESAYHEILRGLATSAGAKNLPTGQRFVLTPEPFQEPSKQPPRIGIIGFHGDATELIKLAEAAGLDATLRFVDGRDETSIHRCDYAIVIRKAGAHGIDGADSDRAIGKLGRSQVILGEDPEPAAVLQHIRTLCARQ